MIRHLVNIILYNLPPSRYFSLRRFLMNMASINVESSASICGRGWIYGRGNLTIGEGSWLSPGVIFYTHLDAEISIGSHCDIGPSVEFIVGSHEIAKGDRRAGKGISNNITVGNGTWIGAKVLIIDGVSIGSGCVIAAGSVVCSDVKDNCLIAGIPAVVKRKLI